MPHLAISGWRRWLDCVMRPTFLGAVTLCSVVLIALAIIITLESLLRSFANYSMDFVHELTGYGVALLTIVGGAVSMREQGFFRVQFVFKKFPATVRTVLTWIYILLSLVFCVGMFVYTLLLAIASWEGGNVSSTTLATPLYIPQIVLPLGFALFVLFLIELLLLRGRHSVDDADNTNRSD